MSLIRYAYSVIIRSVFLIVKHFVTVLLITVSFGWSDVIVGENYFGKSQPHSVAGTVYFEYLTRNFPPIVTRLPNSNPTDFERTKPATALRIAIPNRNFKRTELT